MVHLHLTAETRYFLQLLLTVAAVVALGTAPVKQDQADPAVAQDRRVLTVQDMLC
jgi:hypothetical protein